MTSLVWLASWRNLRWRQRRFVIAVGATTLVFAITLLLTGFREGIDVETARTVRALGADAFIVKEGAPGPFTTLSHLSTDVADEVARAPGVRRADPVLTMRHRTATAPATDVYLVGARPGGVGMPPVEEGRAPRRRGEAAIDTRGHRELGDHVRVGDRSFEVVGLFRRVSVWAGVPTMAITLDDAQDLVFSGQPVATTIVTEGVPSQVPRGLRAVTEGQARADLQRPLENAVVTIDLLRLFLWVVAAAVVGSVLYLSALERSRDFAVFKSFVTATADLVATLVVEALALALLSALASVGVARLLAPLFPAVISLPVRTLLLLGTVAVPVGVAGSLAGARRVMAIDPALAFAGP